MMVKHLLSTHWVEHSCRRWGESRELLKVASAVEVTFLSTAFQMLRSPLDLTQGLVLEHLRLSMSEVI